MDRVYDKCPKCGNPIIRLMSLCYGFSRKNANQFSEVLNAKYWRDNNGVRHKVTAADGHAKSATTGRRRTVPDEVVEARKQRDVKKDQARRQRGI